MTTTAPTDSLSDTIDAIFAACILRYGKAYFMARWAGQTVAAVKADWRRVMEGYQHKQPAVRYGLKNLPEKPPMAHEFKALCDAWRPPVVIALPEPKPAMNPDLRTKLREQLAAARAQAPDTEADRRAHASQLRDRELAGERLSMGQKDFWRRVLQPGKAMPAAPGNERTPA